MTKPEPSDSSRCCSGMPNGLPKNGSGLTFTIFVDVIETTPGALRR
jgi:hypothetical protein